MNKTNFAFTLAEVLITLGIIGVVAAMTIPGLMSKYREIVTVSKVKETYSILAQAEKRWEEELDCLGDVAACISGCESFTACTLKDLVKNIKYSDIVFKGQNNNKHWLADSCFALNGQRSLYGGVTKGDTYSGVKMLLPNGASVDFEIDTNKQSIAGHIDINNSAPPNRIGIDVFPIGIGAYKNDYYKGLQPYHTEDNETGDDKGLCAIRNGKICSPDDGRSPTAYVLKHNKVFDLKKLGY
ncbi:MAG: type II secretion system GspH family protein [Muribaculaceae bacterium]|nr:type II secretion system GspH family protein [Muribaculaceae bacterium]